MSQVAHVTELEAVNLMLFSIGERPVNTLSSGLGDAALALSILRDNNRVIQLRGWLVNTRPEVTLSKNTDNQFAVGDNILRVDTVDPDPERKVTTGSTQRPPSSHFNVSLRRSGDDSKWLLYDVDRDSETWTTPDTLLVSMIVFLEFDDLNPALQYYVTAKAARQFQKGGMASRVLFEFTADTEREALQDAMAYEADDADLNVLRKSPTIRNIVQRRNYLWGR